MKTLCLCALMIFSSTAHAMQDGVQGGQQGRADTRFEQADRNRDGKLSLAEMQDAQDARLVQHFATVDRNGDGFITRDEQELARKARHERWRERHSQRKAKHQERQRKLMALDKDGDGAFTRAELGDQAPKLSERFDQIDADRDGKLTREELREAWAQRRAGSTR